MQTVASTTTASHIHYNAYGYTKMLIQGPYSSGFNGEYFNIHTHGYHLGQGYRVYSPALTRSPVRTTSVLLGVVELIPMHTAMGTRLTVSIHMEPTDFSQEV